MRKLYLASLSAALALVVAGCGSDDDDKGSSPSPQAAPVGVKAAGLIAFRRYFDESQTTGAIFTIRPDGKAERQLTHPPNGTVDDQPAISADGSQIAFERCPADESCRAFVMDADGSHERGLKVPCTLRPICDSSGPAWGPNGQLAVNHAEGSAKTGSFGDQIERSEVVVLDPQRGTTRTVAGLDNFQGDVGQPVWSPDGRSIAYQQEWSALSKRSGIALRVVPAAGGASRQVTPYKVAGGDHPDWSPDGRWLIFRTDADLEPGAPSHLATVHSDGSGLRQFDTPGDTVLSSSYSPDGKWIVYSGPGRGDTFDLFVMRSDGSDVHPLTRTALWDSAPDWGP